MKGPQTVREALRSASAAQHDAIEALLELNADFDRAHYERVVAGFDAFLRDWEPVVAAALPEPSRAWFAARSRRPFLQRDLAALGTRPLERCAAVPFRVDSVEAAWGAMYVLEGSALGGQLIARRLAERLAITPEAGGAYFSGWGAETGRRWRAFCARLESEVGTDAAARERACRGALDTFDALIDTFRIALNEPTVV